MSPPLPRYAQLENERRFRVDPRRAPPLGPATAIYDLYITGTRLRLRRMTAPDGAITYKLCRKYPSDDPLSAPITNLYLDPAEAEVLRALPGDRLVKARHHVDAGGHRFAVDVFGGVLAGLVLAEVEAPTRAAVAAIVPPDWAGEEVTERPEFTGAALARCDSARAAALIAR